MIHEKTTCCFVVSFLFQLLALYTQILINPMVKRKQLIKVCNLKKNAKNSLDDVTKFDILQGYKSTFEKSLMKSLNKNNNNSRSGAN